MPTVFCRSRNHARASASGEDNVIFCSKASQLRWAKLVKHIVILACAAAIVQSTGRANSFSNAGCNTWALAFVTMVSIVCVVNLAMATDNRHRGVADSSRQSGILKHLAVLTRAWERPKRRFGRHRARRPFGDSSAYFHYRLTGQLLLGRTPCTLGTHRSRYALHHPDSRHSSLHCAHPRTTHGTEKLF